MSLDLESNVSIPARPVTAPTWPIGMAIAAAGAAVALLLPGINALTAAATGYVAGALLTPAFTVVFRFCRQSAAKSPSYVPRLSVERILAIALTIGILAGAANAWFVATELAKQ